MPTYTAEEVEKIISRFEKAADKQISKAPEDVATVEQEFLKPGFTVAETSLLTEAEAVRDICAKAVLGTTAADRDYLDEVFGAGCNCERFCRLRDVLSKVTLSKMSAQDPRWQQVSAKIQTIEEILKQRGSFKMPKDAAQPPSDLKYPKLADSFAIGEELKCQPTVEGDVSTYSVEPALPAGLTLDAATGQISGTLQKEAPQTTYVVTASSEAGSTSVSIGFKVTQPAPTALRYPAISASYNTGDSVSCKPEVEGGKCSKFSVEPALPEGIVLDPATGAISGAAKSGAELTTYKITGENERGKVSCEMKFEIIEAEPDLISRIDDITDINELLSLDPGKDCLLTWMVWMVHRAWLDDDTLDELNFTDLEMPPPHVQPKVAPKLMKALQERNTKMMKLKLAATHLQPETGHELAGVMKANKTLKVIDVTRNDLDTESIRDCAQKLAENPDTQLEQWLSGHQKGMDAFGSATEQAIVAMMKDNLTLTRLGITMKDANCRDSLDRYIIRNVDRARRKSQTGDEELVVAEVRTISAVVLSSAPEKTADATFVDEAEIASIVRAFCVEKLQIPTKEQLQSFAKNQGKSVPFAKAAPAMKSFVQQLLDAAAGTKVSLVDSYSQETPGTFHAWSAPTENTWSFQMIEEAEGQRLLEYKGKKQPPIKFGPNIVEWLKP